MPTASNTSDTGSSLILPPRPPPKTYGGIVRSYISRLDGGAIWYASCLELPVAAAGMPADLLLDRSAGKNKSDQYENALTQRVDGLKSLTGVTLRQAARESVEEVYGESDIDWTVLPSRAVSETEANCLSLNHPMWRPSRRL